MNKLFLIIISAVSLCIRFVYGYFSLYNCDQARVFDLGFQIYKYHILPTHGSPIVYTNSLLPGSLQAILAAIPLYFSQGHPFSIIIFVQLLNFISCFILFKIYSNLFDNINKYFMFAFVILNPMNIMWSYGWNPSFMIIFVTLFFLGMIKLIANNNDKFGLCLLFFPLIFLLQLNLQFLILVFLVFIIILNKIIKINSIPIAIISLFSGVITLIPLFIQKFRTVGTLKNNWNMNGNIIHNVQLNIENILSYFHILARFLSFTTGETTRGLEEGFIKHNPIMWPLFFIGILVTGVLFIISIIFYLDIKRWKKFFNSSKNFSVYEKIDWVLLCLPLITTFLFIFSVTPPTTHKIWILFPFSFYPFFRILSLIDLKKYYKHFKIVISIYLFSCVTYTTVGASHLQPNFYNVFRDSKVYCELKTKNDVDVILNTVDSGSKEYAMAMLCQYHKEF